MIASAPIARHSSALYALDTTQIGVAPAARASWVADEPRPPLAPQISTLSPCFIAAPLAETSWRYAVELTRPGDAASSQVRCAGLGISWFDFTSARSARPPKLVSKPQMRCSGSSLVSLWPSASSSSTDRQWATTRSPAFHRRTPGPVRSTTPARSEPITWYGRACRAAGPPARAYRARNANVGTGAKMALQTVL